MTCAQRWMGTPSSERGTTFAPERIEMVVFDFDGVFTDNTVHVSQDGVESVRCWTFPAASTTRVSGLPLGSRDTACWGTRIACSRTPS